VTATPETKAGSQTHGSRPRLGFLGVGWIGRSRMQALAATGLADLVAVAEPDPALRRQALALSPGAEGFSDLAGLLSAELDGVVIATPRRLVFFGRLSAPQVMLEG